MQMTAQAQAGQGLPPGGPPAGAAAAAAGIPPGLLAGHPPVSAAAAVAAAGLPNTLSLLAGIPSSVAGAGGPNLPHPAFASLLAQQKPGGVPVTTTPGALIEAVGKAKEEDLKRPAETNGGESSCHDDVHRVVHYVKSTEHPRYNDIYVLRERKYSF